MLLFELEFDILLSSELTLNMATLNIQDFCHELCLSLGQVEPLLRKFKALRLIVVAEFAQSEVDLLEVVSVRIVNALLLDLLDFSKELNKHLLGAFLTCKLVLSTQLFGLLPENLLELGEALSDNLWIAQKLLLHVSSGSLFGVFQESLKVNDVYGHGYRFECLLQVVYG